MDFYTERVVKWDNGSVLMIDQTKLPLKLSYIRCVDYREIIGAITRLAVRGAPAIGVAAAMGLALVAWHSKAKTKNVLLLELENAGHDLENARPTAVNLQWAIERVMKKAGDFDGGLGDLKTIVVDEALLMADEDVQANLSIGTNGSSLLEDGDVVLTHCKWPYLASRTRGPSPPLDTAQR